MRWSPHLARGKGNSMGKGPAIWDPIDYFLHSVPRAWGGMDGFGQDGGEFFHSSSFHRSSPGGS